MAWEIRVQLAPHSPLGGSQALRGLVLHRGLHLRGVLISAALELEANEAGACHHGLVAEVAPSRQTLNTDIV